MFWDLSLLCSTERRQAQRGTLTCSRSHRKTLIKPFAGRFPACPFSHALCLLFGPGPGLAPLLTGEMLCHSLVSRACWSRLYWSIDKVSSRESVTSDDAAWWRCKDRSVQPTCRLAHEGLTEAIPSSVQPGHPYLSPLPQDSEKQPRIDSWGQIQKGNGHFKECNLGVGVVFQQLRLTTSCSSRGRRFDSQPQHDRSQAPITPLPWDLMPSSELHRH